LRLAAVQGQGLAMAPAFLFADDIKSGRLVPVLTEFSRTEYAVNAIYPHRQHVSAKVRSFIDLLAKRFREDPAWADPCRACTGSVAAIAASPVAAVPALQIDGVAAGNLLPQH
jgi:LysR substrate binding domain